tara:strand:+ start:3390 stop:5555 length:2166 start_codon:yes stop_codon:yes gene_type:complete
MSTATVNGIAMADIATINGQTIAAGAGSYDPVAGTGTYTETVPTGGLLKIGGLSKGNTPSSNDSVGSFDYGAATVVNISSDEDGRYQIVAESKSDFVKITYGRYAAFGITAGGQLWELGSSSTYIHGSATSTWQQVTGVGHSDTTWEDVSSSYDGALAINRGEMFHIGQNSYGQSGNGSTSSQYNSFAQVGTDNDWMAVHRSRNWSVAIKTSNKVAYVAGRNYLYQTGLNTNSGNTTSWTAINSDNFTNANVEHVSLNADGGILILNNGECYGWGAEDSNERFGLNNSADLTKPTAIGTVGGTLQTNWMKGALSGTSCMLINTNKELFFTGEGSRYHRGDGVNTDEKNGNFIQIGTDTDHEEVSFGGGLNSSSQFACVVQKGNKLYYSGQNRYGNIIDNGQENVTTRTLIKSEDLASGNVWTVSHVAGSYLKPYVAAIYPDTSNQSQSQGNLLLNLYTGAAAAYSVRKLDKDFAGSCMRIRRDSDDSETDIGFDSSGDLDTSAIATHCGSANGYVVTWYDQANVGGTAKNATQSTRARQPKIYNGSAVIQENGKPAVDFSTAANIHMTFDIFYSASQAFINAYFVYKMGGANYQYLFGSNNQDKGYLPYHFANTPRSAAVRNDVTIAEGATISQGNQVLRVDEVERTSVTIFVDGSQSATTSDVSADFSMPSTNLILGSGNPSLTAAGFSGAMQEVILYPSDQSTNRSSIETDINNYFSIY